MKLSNHILRKPFYVAFGTAQQGSGITSVDLVTTRNATAVTMTASDGSAAPIAGADANTAGVMTAIDKSKLDSIPTATARDIATKLDASTSTIGTGITHLRTAGHLAAGDGGAALYKRVGAEPTHNLKVRSADLAWWEIVPTNNVIPFQACGGVEGDSAANGAANVTAFNNFIGYAQALFAIGTAADGPTLQFPKGNYHFSTHLNVKAAIRIQGAGATGEGVHTASVLRFPPDSHGIIVQDSKTIDDITTVTTFSGSGTIIQGLWLEGGGFPATDGHGIWLRSQGVVRNCVVQNFGLNGINIVANFGSGGAIEGNANAWAVEHVLAKRIGQNGLFVSDGDANVGYAEQFQAQLCGRWGIWDDSFLGNTYNACNVATNGVVGAGQNAAGQSSYVSFGGKRYSANVAATEAQLVATTPGTDETIWITGNTEGPGSVVPLWVAAQPEGTYFHGGAYHSSNINARNTFVGCYREDDHGQNQLAAPTVFFGGLMGTNRGTAAGFKGTLTGANISGRVSFSNSGTFFDTATEQLDLEINRFDGKAIRLLTPTDWITLVGYEKAEDVFTIGEYNNSNSLRPIYITTATSASTLNGGRSGGLGGGQIIFPQGIFIGDQRFNARHMTNGTVAPTTGEHARGEIVWNRNMAAGGVIAWVCTVTGTPGTWVEMRGAANQTTGASQAALVNSTGGVGDGTISAVGDTSTVDQSAVINDNLTELHTLLDEMRTTLVNFGLMKGGV